MPASIRTGSSRSTSTCLRAISAASPIRPNCARNSSLPPCRRRVARHRPTVPAEDPLGDAADDVPEHVSQNIDSIIAFHRREQFRLSAAQRRVEQLAGRLGRPGYLLGAAALAILWLLYNLLAPDLHLRQIDPPPFFWLQGLFSLGAFFTATVVLIAQNRQARFETQRLNLDLQVNLLTEQKA